MTKEELLERVAATRWYHTMELAHGVVTPGWFDLRPSMASVPLPLSLDGLRCLDVGSWDGFWAFEMERRGAAEVVALDVADGRSWDWPPRALLADDGTGLRFLDEFKARDAGWAIAHEALGSTVQRRVGSVYEAAAAELGRFDVVFVGTLLMHLRDPVRALDRLRTVCRGRLVVAEAIELVGSVVRPRTPTARLDGDGRPWWWQPNAAGLRRMVEAAGFDILSASRPYFVRLGERHPPTPVREHWRRALLTPAGREGAILAAFGLPHVALAARPLGP